MEIDCVECDLESGYCCVDRRFCLYPAAEALIVAVTALAIGTEAAFWMTAGILGIGLVESRKRVFGIISRPFRGRSESER